MTWKAPKIIEVPVGMEINMYACAPKHFIGQPPRASVCP